MKKIRSFRIDENLDKKLSAVATQFNLTTSQIIELACLRLLSFKVDSVKTKTTKKDADKKRNQLTINLNMNDAVFGKLVDEVNKKNSTFTQEVLYRVSASLDNPVFDSQEFNKLWALRTDLNRLGNLVKLAINNQATFDNDLLIETNKNVDLLRNEITELLKTVRKRTFSKSL